MKHYFIENNDLPIAEHILPLTIFGQNFSFLTCNGLFSYEKVDGASILLLEVLQASQPFSGKILDLGCGYGLLGIVLAKIHALTVTLSDTNKTACLYAEKNVKRNFIQAEVLHSNGFAAIDKHFDHIVCNPPIHAGKDVVYRLYEESAAFLLPGGALYIVIQKKHGAETTLVFLSKIFDDVKILHKRKGYYVLRCAKGM
jgi:16S rRNA (guanine1207-N2)-methyltransferase